MVSLTIVGVLVPYNDENLLNGSSSSDANASPFVIAVRNAGISGVPSIMNAVILIAVLSVGNSSIYGASRTLAALADRGQAPKILGYIDRSGRPLVSITVCSAVGFLCYIVAAGPDTTTQAFNWMLAISGLAAIFTWYDFFRVDPDLANKNSGAPSAYVTFASDKHGKPLVVHWTSLLSNPKPQFTGAMWDWR